MARVASQINIGLLGVFDAKIAKIAQYTDEVLLFFNL
jgi:hypothetical protein